MSDDRITLTDWSEVREAMRTKDLRQAGYTEGAIVMADCLLDLHGDAHRERRRLENRLFRRETFAHWEHQVLGTTITATLDPFVEAGRGDLAVIGYRSAMNLTATIAGIDHDVADPAGTERLYGIVKTFSEGATIAHSTRDKDDVRSEVADAMARFAADFYRPALERRTELVRQVEAGALADDALPHDVLTTLVRNEGRLSLPDDVRFREICFYLQAGAHSTANAFVHTVDEILADDALATRARADRALVQRCMHEALRLHPASPVAVRTPLADVTLSGGRRLPTGSTVVCDLLAANRDPAVFGADADDFVPGRALPDGVAPWGMSFGGGTHACIGAELDGGLEQRPAAGGHPGDDHLYGTVAVMAHAFLAAGGRADPHDPPELDPASTRRHYRRYPVVF